MVLEFHYQRKWRRRKHRTLVVRLSTMSAARKTASAASHEMPAESSCASCGFANPYNHSHDQFILSMAALPLGALSPVAAMPSLMLLPRPKSTTPSYAGKREMSEMTPTQSCHFQKNCFECMWQDAAFGDFAKPAVPGSAKRHARADHAQEHSSWEADPRNAGKAMPAHLEKLLQQAQLTPKGTQPLAIPKRMAELFQMSFAPKAGPPDVALPPPPPLPPPAPPAPPQPTRHVSAAETSSAAKSSSTAKSLSAVANKMQAQPKKPTPPWHLKSVAALLPWHCLLNPVKDDPEIAFPCRQAPYCDALCQWCDWRRHNSLCLMFPEAPLALGIKTITNDSCHMGIECSILLHCMLDACWSYATYF